jgi:uncharacterized protein DUF4145
MILKINCAASNKNSDKTAMDEYQFVSSLFQSSVTLAWPAALVVIVWLFRDKLENLLPLARVKYKDLELRFQDAAMEAAKLEETPVTPGTEPTPEEVSRFAKMAKLAPRGAMLEVRANLEEAVREYAQAIGMPNISPYMSYGLLIRRLRGNQLIDENTSALLDDLRAIGNAAAHNQSDPTEQDALRYQALAEQLIRQLRISTAAAEMSPPGPIPPGG